MVFDPTGPIPERRLLHRHRAIAGTHRCFHRSIQRDSTALRLDQEKGLPAAVQEPPYHSTLIPGTRALFDCVELQSSPSCAGLSRASRSLTAAEAWVAGPSPAVTTSGQQDP